MIRMTIVALSALALVFVLVISCAPTSKVYVGGEDIGRPKFTYAKFENVNLEETKVTYRISIDDPKGAFNVVIVRPRETSVSVRVPLGRIKMEIEAYLGAEYRYTREEDILITPAQEGKAQLFRIREPDGVE